MQQVLDATVRLPRGSGSRRRPKVASLSSVSELHDEPLLPEVDLSVHLQPGLQPPALTPSPYLPLTVDVLIIPGLQELTTDHAHSRWAVLVKT